MSTVNAATNVAKPKGKYRWVVCALLFFATTINYLDRQVLSLLKPKLEELYHWTNSDYADIMSIFQISYAISLILAGKIIDKLDTKKGYSLAIIVWSLGAVLHAFALPIGNSLLAAFGWAGIAAVPASVLGFIFCRVILAFGESGNFPAAIKATAEYFPKKERAFSTGIFNSGANIGAILAPLCVPYIATRWGWEYAFIIIGSIGFLWLIFWYLYYDKPERQKRLSQEELTYINSDSELVENIHPTDETRAKPIPWFKLLTLNQTWAFAIGKFLTDGVWWFFLFWLPAFLKDQYHMATIDMALPLTVLYSMTMLGSIGGGWFPQYFFNKGYKPYDGRMRAMLVIAMFPLVVLLASPLGGYSYWVPVILIGIGASAHQAWSANIFSTVSDMFPKRAIGSVIGIGGMAGGIGGALITKIGGALFDKYKAEGHIETGYAYMFAFCAVAYLIAWVLMKLLVPRTKIVNL